MKIGISEGQFFVDADGNTVEVLSVGENGIGVRDADSALHVATIGVILQDIASGDLSPADYED